MTQEELWGRKENGKDNGIPIEENYKTEEYLNVLGPLGRLFAGYGYEIKVIPGLREINFDYQRRVINYGLGVVEELQLAPEDEKYVLLHELAHLVQFLSDPKSYVDAFVRIPKEKGKSDPLLEKAWREFFNCFFDIHANSIIKAHMPLYQKGGSLENLPRELYSKKAFPPNEEGRVDYSSYPLSYQFIYYLLRRTMVDNEEIIISDEVKELIDKKIDFLGEEYSSLEEFVRVNFFNPSADLSFLMSILEMYLAPIYEDLLEKDMERGNLRKKFAEDFEGIDIDGVLNGNIEKIFQELNESKKTPDQKYKENQEKRFIAWAEKQGFSEEQIKRIMEIRGNTWKTIEDLEDLWRSFIQTSTSISNEKVEGFKTGAGISSESLSSQIPVLLTNPTEARIFYRNLPSEEEPTIRPRKINLALIVDLSGSMDENKRRSVQETAYALVKSLINFRRTGELSYADRGGNFPIDIYYQIIGFGDSVEELTKDTEEEKQNRIKRDALKDLDQEIINAVLAIGKIGLGGTQDCLALEEVLSLINDDQEFTARLKSGEELLVVLEITDGETQTPKESKKLIESLNSLPNVFCRAIQIQDAISSEDLSEKEKTSQDQEAVLEPPLQVPPSTDIFENVWGDWGKRLNRLGALKETMVAILHQALNSYI